MKILISGCDMTMQLQQYNVTIDLQFKDGKPLNSQIPLLAEMLSEQEEIIKKYFPNYHRNLDPQNGNCSILTDEEYNAKMGYDELFKGIAELKKTTENDTTRQD